METGTTEFDPEDFKKFTEAIIDIEVELRAYTCEECGDTFFDFPQIKNALCDNCIDDLPYD